MENIRNRRNNSSLFSNNNKRVISLDLIDGLSRLREQGSFCDIKLKTDSDEVLLAHKIVLCACSPYFNVLFSGSFKEADQTEFFVKDVPGDCLKILIDYIYTGLLKFDSSNVERVLLAASFLQITTAEEICSTFLQNNLVLDNCIQYILFSGKHSIKSLRLKSIEMAVINFHNIYPKDEYLEIDFDEFRLLVKKIKMSGYIEDVIFSFVMRWIHHSYENRVEFLQDLLNYLNPLQISPDLLETIRSSRTIPYLDHWATPATSVNLNESQVQILITRRISDFAPRTVKFFTQNDQYEIQSLPECIFDGSYVCFGYNIFHLGGWKNKKLITDATYTFHKKNLVWSPFVPLLKARAYHRSGALNGTIYTIGGSDGLKALPYVEYIDLHTGKRDLCKDLPQPKEQMGLAFYKNSIYTIGGKNRAIDLKCVQRYDPRVGSWEEMETTSYKAGASSCAVVNDDIYTTHKDALQRYDVRTNRWTLIRTQYNRYPDEVFSVDNKLYGLFKDHIGLYVLEAGKWSVYRQLNYHHNYLSVSTNLRCPLATNIVNANGEEGGDEDDHDHIDDDNDNDDDNGNDVYEYA